MGTSFASPKIFIQAFEEGRDPALLTALRDESERIATDRGLVELHRKLLAVPIRCDFYFREPNKPEEIRKLRNSSPSPLRPDFDDEELVDKRGWRGERDSRMRFLPTASACFARVPTNGSSQAAHPVPHGVPSML